MGVLAKLDMPDFTVRSDSVNVEHIMEQIRARIREKRGVDYTEQQIRELAAVKLEKFLDPRGVRSDLLEQFRRVQPAYAPPELPNYAFEEQTLYESTRPPLRWIRRLLQPLLKLFFNPNPLIRALHIQSQLNSMSGEREARREATRREFDHLQYELMHNLVIETTRMSIEVKNLKMRVESLASRLEFNERRARALEGVVVYRPVEDRLEAPAAASSAGADFVKRDPGRGPSTGQGRAASAGSRQAPSPGSGQSGQAAPAGSGQAGQVFPAGSGQAGQASSAGSGQAASASSAPAGQAPSAGSEQPGEGPGQRSRRRRRRRGRRGGGLAAAAMSASRGEGVASSSDSPAPVQTFDSQPRASESTSSAPPQQPSPTSSGHREPDPSTPSNDEPATGSGGGRADDPR
jgi:hypothetical protein